MKQIYFYFGVNALSTMGIHYGELKTETSEPYSALGKIGPYAKLEITKSGKTKSCYSCKNYLLCFLRRGIEDQLSNGMGMLNTVSHDQDHSYQDVYIALAGACDKYEEGNE